MTLHKVALVLACMVRAGHAMKSQSLAAEDMRVQATDSKPKKQAMNALMSLLLGLNTKAAWNPSVSGAVLQSRVGQRSSLQMQMPSAETFTDVQFGDQARSLIKSGIDAVANAVKVTLGPKGRNVVLDRGGIGIPEVVNDGVTIARQVSPNDARERVGARLVVEVASKTDARAGDGTTTSTVLAQALVEEGLRLVSAGIDPMALRRGLQKVAQLLVEEVKNISIPVDETQDVESVARIASGSPAMGRTIATAFKRVGKNGATTVEDGQTLMDELEYTEGMEFERGYFSPYFVNNQEMQVCEMDDPRILVTDMKIMSLAPLVPLLEHFVKSKESLLIICDDLKGEALSSLVMNAARGALKVCAVKSPGFGDRRRWFLEDIAVMTNTTFLTDQLGQGLASLTPDDLGRALKVSVGKEKTAIISTGEFQEAVTNRVDEIKRQLADTDEDNTFDIEKHNDRIALLGGAIARIKCGAATETELMDKKLRYEDALNSVKSAMKDGILPGGGSTLIYLLRHKDKIAAQIKDDTERIAVDIFFYALTAPLKQIAKNAGEDGDIVLDEIKDKEFGYGWNAATMQYENLLESGVIDAATVTTQSILNAASVAASVITTHCLITEYDPEVDDVPYEETEDYSEIVLPELGASIEFVSREETPVVLDDEGAYKGIF